MTPLAPSRVDLRQRVRVDGKFFAVGTERLRLSGVTYGPFPPNGDGDPFPNPAQVQRDFARMLGKIEQSLDLVQTSEEADAKEAY